MLITIDKYAGFCSGVNRAVRNAEKILDEKGELFCLGELVHSDEEMKRLINKGLRVISKGDFNELKHEDVMFRAHGEPPESYLLADQKELILHDNTCGIVKKLQEKIKTEFEEPGDKNIVIFGKKNHPEVIGLAGQSNNTAIIIESKADIEKIDFAFPVVLFSQTTMNAEKYDEIIELLEDKAKKRAVKFNANYSICGQVSRRVEKIREFANEYDTLLFISGKNSSNGRYLFSNMQEVNPNSYWISNPEEIDTTWFENASSVGISGATSTPPWLLEKVAQFVKKV